MPRPLLTIELSCDRFDPETPVGALVVGVAGAVATGALGATAVVGAPAVAALGAWGG
jgi:hypothetical protein